MTQTNVRVQMQIRRDTAANWGNANPTPLDGELCYISDTGQIKVGDGSSAWIVLPYSFLPLSGGSLTDHLTIHNKKELRLSDHTAGGANDHYSAFKAGTQSANLTYTLPTALPASSGQVLSCSDAGVMSWASDSTNDSSKMPLAGGSFVGDVIFDNATNAGNDMTWDMSDNALEFNDNVKAIFGTDSTGPMELFHHSSNWNIIRNKSATGLFIESKEDQTGIDILPDSFVKLRYAGGEKLATSTSGISITGDTTTSGKFISNSSSSGDYIRLYAAGGTGKWDIYGNGANLRISDNDSTGKVQIDRAVLLPDDVKLEFGDITTPDLEIYHNGSNSYLDNNTGSLIIRTNVAADVGGDIFIKPHDDEDGISVVHDAGVSLYYAGTGPKLETTSTGIKPYGNVDIQSAGSLYVETNGKVQLGNSQEFKIYYSGSNNILECGNSKELHINNGEASNLAKFIPGGAAELYFDGTSAGKKLETTSTGAKTSGIHLATGDIASNYIMQCVHSGNSVNRYGLIIQCGANDGSGTNYPIGFETPTGVSQGVVTFTSGTVTYGPFTANHPCIVPEADNPSNSSNAYPYGTLLETISIEYTKNNGVDTERGIRYKIQKTQSANSKKVLGAYGGSMNGGPSKQTNEHQALVLGDGHILVNNAGGNIEIGDGICSSATAGIGQKATANPSMIIGIAQENITFTGSETKLVAVQYGLQQFTPWS